ncbi:hypothetical protein FSP39_012642 [Pinctada imbricata]|uniref:Mediator of RNA polymerase II transcription subunit 28 n=1 Tax=Pinctada imbricata TaxID=66713 RepID=A0AA88Y0B2_PINIB|nr:hypothetical protein FSP39_012642 [Pinctada imbricata]
MASNGSGTHLVDDLEAAFQNCLSGLTSQEHFNVQDVDEIKAGTDQTVLKFLEIARQTEVLFLHKRLILSKQKPEQLMKDETDDLRAELERKDLLIKRHQEKLQQWQAKLKQVNNKGPISTAAPSTSQLVTQNPLPMGPPHQQQQHPVQHGPVGYGGMMRGQSQINIPDTGQGQGINIGPGPGFHQQSQIAQSQPSHMMLQRQGSGQGPGPGHQLGPHQPPPAYPQGPLQFLEQTMSSIGMPERR